jgi:type 1 fimbria pilin
MKKLTRLYLIIAFSISLLFCNVTAMPQESVVMTVSADVLGALTITKVSDLDFGNISGTTTGEVFLDPQGAESAYVGATATAGEIEIGGEGAVSIRIGWPESISLSDGAGSIMTLTLAVSGYGSNDQSSSTDILLDGDYATVNLVSNAFYLWVGGSLGQMSAVTPGAYAGNAIFTVEYN